MEYLFVSFGRPFIRLSLSVCLSLVSLISHDNANHLTSASN